MRTALLCIATGQRYQEHAQVMLESAKQFFPEHDSFVWTDSSDWRSCAKRHFYKPALGYPQETLRRYHTFLEQRDMLAQYDQCFYVDADMRWAAPARDIFSEGITATLHPGYFQQPMRKIRRMAALGQKLEPGELYIGKAAGYPEIRKESTAYLLDNEFYYCGGFNGGSTRAYLRMAETIAKNIDTDLEKNIIAIWADESHLNRYLNDNPPAKTLSPSYCFPEGYDGGYGWSADAYPPVLIAIDKRGQRE